MKMKTQYTTTQEIQQILLRGKFVTINKYIKKQKVYQINSLTVHIKGLEKEEKMKPKADRKKGPNKDLSRDKCNGELKNSKITETKIYSSKRSTKLINLQLDRLKKKKEKTQITKNQKWKRGHYR